MGNNSGGQGYGLQGTQSLIGFQNVGIKSSQKSLTICYANVVLQVLLHHPVFLQLITNANNTQSLLYKLRELLGMIQGSKSMESVSTNKLMNYIYNQSALFDKKRHEDCQQFYTWLLSTIDHQMKGKDKLVINKFQEQFSIQIVTEIRCLNCNLKKQIQQKWLDMSVDIPEPNVSLNYCIQQMKKVQKLSGSNKYDCRGCKTMAQAQRQIKVKYLPRFLAVHLKRFKFNQAKKTMQKINWLVSFPLRMKLYTEHTEVKERLYRLVGVIVHTGSGQSYGHYFSYIRVGLKWFSFNDDQISQIEDYEIQSLWGYKHLSKCAYMLFYSI